MMSDEITSIQNPISVLKNLRKGFSVKATFMGSIFLLTASVGNGINEAILPVLFMQNLETENPELAEEVRNQMFVFDDIANLTDKEIQLILREVDSKDLAVALKGGSEELQERIFGNVSERVGTMIKEEMQFSGPVRMSDVEEVQLRVVQTVRQLEEAGQVTVVRGDTGDVFV